MSGLSRRFLLRATHTVEPLDFYVEAAGDDDNDGTQANPLQTLAEVEARIPTDVRHPVTIHLKAETYEAAVFRRRLMSAGIFFVADKAWDATVETTITTDAAEAGTGASVVKVTGLAGAVPGDTIEFTSGAAIGKRRTINDYTDPDLEPAIPWSGSIPADGDTFKITRWNTCQINFSPGAVAAMQYLVGGDGRSGNSAQADTGAFAGYCFVGIQLRSSDLFGRVLIREATCAFFGCSKAFGGTVLEGNGWDLEIVSSNVGFGMVGSMLAPAFLSQAPLSLASADDWFGWGINQEASDLISVVRPTDNSHVRMVGRINYFTSGGTPRYFSDTHFVGRADPPASTFIPPLYLTSPASLRVGRFNYPKTRVNAQNATHACVNDGRELAYANGLRIENTEIASVDGDCVRVLGTAAAAIRSDVTGAPSGSGMAVRARYGARAMLEGAPALGGGGSDYDVGNGAPQNKSYFAADGDHQAHTDGSVIVRVS